VVSEGSVGVMGVFFTLLLKYETTIINPAKKIVPKTIGLKNKNFSA